MAGEDLFLATTFSFGSGCCCIERVLFFEEVVELGRELFRHCSNVVVGYGCVIIFFGRQNWWADGGSEQE